MYSGMYIKRYKGKMCIFEPDVITAVRGYPMPPE